MFTDGHEATRFMLAESASALRHNLEFVIVGGWVPILRGAGLLPHPGTRDVDILLAPSCTPESLQTAVRGLIEQGYIPSAKHEFQLGRVLQLQGGLSHFFTIDFLHPDESKQGFGLFADHFEWPSYWDRSIQEKFGMKSIMLPNGHVIFNCGLWTPFSISYQRGSIDIPLLSEVGLLITKARSFTVKKRVRDAFDIFYTLFSHPDKETLAAGMRQARRDDRVDAMLLDLEYQVEGFEDFDANVALFLVSPLPDHASPAAYVLESLRHTRSGAVSQ